MSHRSDKIDSEILELLQVDKMGWNVSLFKDPIKASGYLCDNCGSICRDAVELGCDHDDEEIVLYCNDCLRVLIQDNDGKCPLNSHSDPIVTLNRSTRRQILRATAICPFSALYKSRLNKQQQQNDGIGGVMVTAGGDEEKEGNIAPGAYETKENDNNNDKSCEWSGSFKELINNHVKQCIATNDPTFVIKIENDKLKKENTELKQENMKQKEDLIAMRNEMEMQNDKMEDYQKQILYR